MHNAQVKLNSMLTEFAKKFTQKEGSIQNWLDAHLEQISDPIYSSVDLRNAGFKIAPVDTNIFPGGFNNLCPSYQKKVGELMEARIKSINPLAKKILLIPENHTRNTYYLSNIKKLENILKERGFKLKIGSLNPDFKKVTELETADNEIITLRPIRREGNQLTTDNFKADIYLLNNDLSAGIPDLLKNLDKPLVPSPQTGWHIRQKSNHFSLYTKLIKEFAQIIDIDYWLLDSYSQKVDDVNFSSKTGMDELAKEIDLMIKKITQKYKDYKINETPYVFIKNNSGTYGMGVTNARSGAEIIEFNRKQRNKMSKGKSSTNITSVIIQEGIPTIDRFKGLVAEPVIYLANNQVAGGFFRLNNEKGERSNLNSKGMKFSKLCFHEMLGYSNEYKGECDLECLSKIYQTIAQIASIAAGYETLELTKANE